MKLKIKKQDQEKIKEFLIGVGCIGIGTAVGIATYVFCLIIHLAIFGWNLGLVISPLVAGYVETYFANKFIGETTGAVSAFILFLVTVVYGFIIANPTLGLNAITIGSAIIILQAALPTLINYFLFVMIIAIVSYMSGIFKKITDFSYELYLKIISKLKGEEYIKKERIPITTEYDINKHEIDINNLGVLFLSTTHPWGKEVQTYNGIYEGKIIIKSAQREQIKAKPGEREKNLLNSLKQAKDQALLNLCQEVKNKGGNGVLDLTIEYDTLGTNKGDNILQIVARGTGVILTDKKNKDNELIKL